jgi:hypothetical protein
MIKTQTKTDNSWVIPKRLIELHSSSKIKLSGTKGHLPLAPFGCEDKEYEYEEFIGLVGDDAWNLNKLFHILERNSMIFNPKKTWLLKRLTPLYQSRPLSGIKTPKSSGVTLAKDADGYFCYTQRARSKSYKSIANIPKSVIELIASTG